MSRVQRFDLIVPEEWSEDAVRELVGELLDYASTWEPPAPAEEVEAVGLELLHGLGEPGGIAQRSWRVWSHDKGRWTAIRIGHTEDFCPVRNGAGERCWRPINHRGRHRGLRANWR